MTWDDLPVELVDIILRHITRQDARNLRRVSKALERKVSPALFRSVVVPFNSELQDMVWRDGDLNIDGGRSKGKGKRSKGQGKRPRDHNDRRRPKSTADSFCGHGYKVFAGFGPHIRKFGMSFDINEDDLNLVPSKDSMDRHSSYHGSYLWPSPKHRRFNNLASLERTADEFTLLRDAMAHLTHVKTLGLYLDSGLGFLAGHDRTLLHRRPKMFKSTAFAPDAKDDITSSASPSREASGRPHSDLANTPPASPTWEGEQPSLGLRNLHLPRPTYQQAAVYALYSLSPIQLDGLDWDAFVQDFDRTFRERVGHPPVSNPYLGPPITPQQAQQQRWRRPGGPPPLLGPPRRTVHPQLGNFGLDAHEVQSQLDGLVTRHVPSIEGRAPSVGFMPCNRQSPARDGDGTDEHHDRSPADLSSTQREWLLQAHSAQRAFFQSYVLSIVDNSAGFGSVKKLSLCFLSSSFVPMLSRHDFWKALPGLQEVSLQVSPEWRSVTRTAGVVTDTKIDPSRACGQVFDLLQNYIGRRRNITTVSVGWNRSVEMACSNSMLQYQHCLPAPIMTTSDMETTTNRPGTAVHNQLKMPFVERLTLTDCYMTSRALISVVHAMQEEKLTSLSLKGVSLVTPKTRAYLRRVDDENLPISSHGFPQQVHRLGTWIVTLHNIAPRPMIQGFVKNLDEPRVRKLERIELEDCGYVNSRQFDARLDAGEDQHAGNRERGFLGGLFGELVMYDGPAAQRYRSASSDPKRGRMSSQDLFLGCKVFDAVGLERRVLQDDFGLVVRGGAFLLAAAIGEVEHGTDPFRTAWTASNIGRFSGVLLP